MSYICYLELFFSKTIIGKPIEKRKREEEKKNERERIKVKCFKHIECYICYFVLNYFF